MKTQAAEAGARQVRLRCAPSAARAATRKQAAPRSACSRSAPPAIAGIRAASARRCGACLNGRLGTGETVRVFPLSNWTERDVWRYILREKLDVVPLYLAKERPTIVRNGQILMHDDDRLPLKPGEEPVRCARSASARSAAGR